MIDENDEAKLQKKAHFRSSGAGNGELEFTPR